MGKLWRAQASSRLGSGRAFICLSYSCASDEIVRNGFWDTAVVLAGDVTATSAISATIVNNADLSGAVSGQAIVTADATTGQAAVDFAGSISAGASLSGNLSKSLTVSGAVNAGTSLTGVLNQAVQFSGNFAAISSVVGALYQTLSLAGEINSSTVLSGTVSKSVLLAGAASSGASLTGAISKSVLVSGALNGSATLSVGVAGTLFFTGSIDSSTSLAMTASISLGLSGAVTASASTQLEVNVGVLRVDLDGNIVATSSLALAISKSLLFEGGSAGVASVAGVLSKRVALAAGCPGSATLIANLLVSSFHAIRLYNGVAFIHHDSPGGDSIRIGTVGIPVIIATDNQQGAIRVKINGVVKALQRAA